ncbi:MAG: MBL fold metallo-hydrolase [Bacteroidota bacterium]
MKILGLLLISLMACSDIKKGKDHAATTSFSDNFSVNLTILGIVQDAGFPQAQCEKSCCRSVWGRPEKQQKVVSLGLSDSQNGKCWLFEATPDLRSQLQQLTRSGMSMDGIFLTHAHIGHYTGLMYLGRESMGAQAVPVYAMPRMRSFLESNGPWDQLVKLKNISLKPLENRQKIRLSTNVSISPILVPHRDEYSETVGYLIEGPSRKALFIPDIDKWEKWEENIDVWIQRIDYAFLDATFFDEKELPGRDMAEIPHPFVKESMQRFEELGKKERAKVHFIHFNHSNPLIDPQSAASQKVLQAGFKIAREGMQFEM